LPGLRPVQRRFHFFPTRLVAGQQFGAMLRRQRPFAHRDAVAQALGLPVESVRVITPAVGGAFGGKDAADVSIEAL